MKKLLILIALFSAPALSAIQCGGYKLTINDSEGLVRINGELVTSQKVKYLGKKGDESNAKWDMGIMPSVMEIITDFNSSSGMANLGSMFNCYRTVWMRLN